MESENISKLALEANKTCLESSRNPRPPYETQGQKRNPGGSPRSTSLHRHVNGEHRQTAAFAARILVRHLRQHSVSHSH